MTPGKELLGATVEDVYFNLRRHTWTGYGERYETYPEAFAACAQFYKESLHMDRAVIETRVVFRYAEDVSAASLDTAIESETLLRTEVERRSKLTKTA